MKHARHVAGLAALLAGLAAGPAWAQSDVIDVGQKLPDAKAVA
jgi:hypothetical protein